MSTHHRAGPLINDLQRNDRYLFLPNSFYGAGLSAFFAIFFVSARLVLSTTSYSKISAGGSPWPSAGESMWRSGVHLANGPSSAIRVIRVGSR